MSYSEIIWTAQALYPILAVLQLLPLAAAGVMLMLRSSRWAVAVALVAAAAELLVALDLYRLYEESKQGISDYLVTTEALLKAIQDRKADPAAVKVSDEEVKAWLAKDPVPKYRARLLDMGINGADIEKIESETQTMIDQATEEARNAPPPPLELAEKDVWANGGSAWRN